MERASEVLVSADSHVIEEPALWKGLLDPQLWASRETSDKHKNGVDPTKRGEEMQLDGVAAEVLFPTLGCKVYGLEDVELHEECCRVYNRWLAEFCSADPERLLAIAMIPCYRPEVAIAELRATKSAGFRGALVWQTPHPDLPFTSLHYDPIWKVAEELDMPINVHILTGFNYSRLAMHGDDTITDKRLFNISRYHGTVNQKLAAMADTMFAFIFGGVFERFPGLRLVIVENEIAWIPFLLDQWDYFFGRFQKTNPTELTKAPSAYFEENVLATFYRDPWVGRMLPTWGKNNLMWSNDFPHVNSTWPKSHEYVASQLSGVSAEIQDRVLRQNCLELYKLGSDVALAAH